MDVCIHGSCRINFKEAYARIESGGGMGVHLSSALLYINEWHSADRCHAVCLPDIPATAVLYIMTTSHLFKRLYDAVEQRDSCADKVVTAAINSRCNKYRSCGGFESRDYEL